MSATGCTSSGFTTGYPWPVQATPYDLLSSRSSCQDPRFTVRPVILPGIHVRWHTIRDTGPNLEVGITWASSTGTPLCGTWLEKRGYHSGVTRGNGKGHIIGNIYKGTCTREKIILPHFLYLCSCILVYSRKPSLWTNIIVTLEYTVSKCVKLFDCLSDPNEPLINWISSPPASSGSGDNCFICV